MIVALNPVSGLCLSLMNVSSPSCVHVVLVKLVELSSLRGLAQ